AIDWSHLTPLLEAELRAPGVPDAFAGDDVPVPVVSVDSGSVASWPLKMSHASNYAASPPGLLSSGLSRLSALTGLHFASSSSTSAESLIRGRCVLVGDAAHTVHPLAGQGLNLGLADARCLSSHLIRASRLGSDLGAPLALAAYEKERWAPNQAMVSATDALHFVYALDPNEERGMKWAKEMAVWARATATEVLNELGPVKEGIASFAGSGRRR
ncbi:hypothetical protein FA09DRAFT_341917, partial [Tilletiopsis washingtonensis]